MKASGDTDGFEEHDSHKAAFFYFKISKLEFSRDATWTSPPDVVSDSLVVKGLRY